jgi:alpha-tubulin suppressor-like RCC1 family protein
MQRLVLMMLMLLFAEQPLLAQQLDGGNGHFLLLENQSVYTVGRNNYGQLGRSEHMHDSLLQKVEGLPPIASIARGYDHSLAISTNGELYAWGRNNYGQLGGTDPSDANAPRLLPGYSDFTAIEGGYWHTTALQRNGTVWAWGHNLYGELGNGTREHSIWPAQVISLRDAATFVPLQDIVSIATVGYHTLALDAHGAVWSWGSNSFGELGYEGEEFQCYAKKMESLPTIQAIAVGWHHSLALDIHGNVWQWGTDPAFQFGEHSAKCDYLPKRMHLEKPVDKIACGSWHSMAVDRDGQLWMWGKNHFGMLGLNDTISRSQPTLVPQAHHIVDIGAGCFQSMWRDVNGTIFTCGDNPSGQLGMGHFDRCYTPQQIALDHPKSTLPIEETWPLPMYHQQPLLRPWIVVFVAFISLLFNGYLLYLQRKKMQAQDREM